MVEEELEMLKEMMRSGEINVPDEVVEETIRRLNGYATQSQIEIPEAIAAVREGFDQFNASLSDLDDQAKRAVVACFSLMEMTLNFVVEEMLTSQTHKDEGQQAACQQAALNKAMILLEAVHLIFEEEGMGEELLEGTPVLDKNRNG